uniref:Collagen, type VI, alpha 3 n=1 Tax=Kryptolebias marmoratus TaxID=37003 RepID=A0A3Q3ART8_KRYMA
MRRHRLLPLCVLLGVLFAGLLPKLDAQDSLGADLYFLVDSSWSMGEKNFEHVRQFLYTLTQSLHQVGRGRFKFALVQYNSRPKTEFHLNSYPTTQDVLGHIKAMSYRGGGTRTGLGLDYLIHSHLTTSSGSRAADGVAQVVVVLTDGRSQDDVSEPAQVLQMAGVEMFAVGVQDAVDSELREMASQPHETHVFNVDSFLKLRDIIQDLVVSAPVAGGGTAQDSADLIFLIDGSENVGAANFPYVRDLILRVIEPLSVGSDAIRVALVQYSSYPEIKFNLNRFYDKSQVLGAVKGLTYSGGAESNLGAAMEEVAESLLSETAGSRELEAVPQVLVIISAGPSSDDTGVGDRALKRANVITLGVSIGDTAAANLEEVATDRRFVQRASDFRTLAATAGGLVSTITDLAMGTIIIQNSFTEVVAAAQRDIIFLIDSTMGPVILTNVVNYIKQFVNSRPIGPDAIQVGVAQFSSAQRVVMDLNTHDTRESLAAALDNIKPRSGQTINMGAALNFVRENMLRPEKGSRMREGVPQVVMLWTSKKSSDGVQQPAEALLRRGVLIMAAGFKTANVDELNQIASSERVVFSAKEFRQKSWVVVEITTVQTQKVVRDIVFLLDGSSYIGNTNFPYVRDFMINLINHLDIRPDRVQIGLIQFAEQPRVEFYLNTYNNKDDVVNKISQLRLTGGYELNIGAAMNYALENMFVPPAGSRGVTTAQQVLVLITGGPSQDDAKIVADKLALAGVLTFTVTSGQADVEEMRKIAFVQDLAYHQPEFSDLPAMDEAVLPSLITVVGDTQTEKKCMGMLVGLYQGSEMDRLTDENRQEPSWTVMFGDDICSDSWDQVEESLEKRSELITGDERDVAFLIDGTDSVRAEFPLIRDFILKVIEPLDIGPDKVRVSVVQHSERPTPTFYLKTYQTKDEVLRAVRGMSLAGGRSLNTGVALRYMKDVAMSESYGSRSANDVPQFLIVLAADRSADNVKEPAGELKTEGVVPFGVGVKNADKKQMEEIAHNPSFAFKVKEFSELETIPQRLNNYVSLPKDELMVLLQEVQNVAVKRDIVFLLDGSDNTRNGFQNIKHFVKSIVESLFVDESLDRVSVVQFADNTKVNFYLNSHKTKNDNINAIDNLTHKGGRRRNVGAALQFVRHRVFTSSTGSRRLEGVPQILILLSSRPSTDSVSGPAFALKEHEIVSFGVGVGDANLAELEMVAAKPDFTYKVADFSQLPSVQLQLLILFCIDAQNIVFLLDGSDDTLRDFPVMKSFVQQVVEALSVGENKDRVSVVQYSQDQQTHFSLKTYMNKQDVLNAVLLLNHKGGKLRNTGAAVDYVRKSVFAGSSGSRHEEGVPQILILLTGGRSQDDVTRVAAALKHENVVPFCVGTRNADIIELQMIAHNPSYAFSILRFEEIGNIYQQLVSFVKRTNVSTQIVSSSESKDIVFLLDSSDGMQSEFDAVLGFVERMVEKLNVDERKDQVSVVQYSKEPSVDFYLNTHQTQQSVAENVKNLRHKGGSPLNTGAALNFVRDNIFTASSGSRRQQGVPQTLVLLTGGRSSDDVRNAAENLKVMGVTVIVVGMKDADILEMQSISQEADVFLAADSSDLSAIGQQILSTTVRNVNVVTTLASSGKNILVRSYNAFKT